VLKLGAQPNDRTGALVALLHWAAEAVRQAVQAMQAAMTAAIVAGATAAGAASGS
jgi:hypothetical protein